MSRAIAALVAGVALLAGCGGSSGVASDVPPPAEDAFVEGACRTAAPDVVAIGRTLPQLGGKGNLPQDVKDTLRDSQAVLAAIAGNAPGQFKPALTDLADKAGLVRTRADANAYDKAQGEQLRSSYEALVRVCTAPPPR